MAYLLILVAALLHALWNGLLKRSSDRVASLVIIRSVGVLLGGALIIFLPPVATSVWPYLTIACAIHIVYFYCLLAAYEHGDFSQVYPIARGIAPLLLVTCGVLLGIDAINGQQALGVGFVSVGIMLLCGRGWLANRKPLLYALATGCCIAGYTLVSGMGVRIAQSFWIYVAWLEFMSGIAFVLYVMATKRYSFSRPLAARFVITNSIGGVLATGGFAIALWAMTVLPIATVAALRETSVIFATLIGWWFLKEPAGPQRLLAALIVFVGVAMLTMNGG